MRERRWNCLVRGPFPRRSRGSSRCCARWPSRGRRLRPRAPGRHATDATPAWTSHGLRTSVEALLVVSERSRLAAQHGPTVDHLPAARENVELISELELKTPDAYKFDPAPATRSDGARPRAGQIADVSIYKNAAYLASRDEPSCRRGGFFSVDVSDPRTRSSSRSSPRCRGTYHGEGTHTITLDTPSFQGDVLAVNNERVRGGRRRRLRPLRRERPGEPEAARAGLRRPVAGPRAE